jgi:hypothetical protein
LTPRVVEARETDRATSPRRGDDYYFNIQYFNRSRDKINKRVHTYTSLGKNASLASVIDSTTNQDKTNPTLCSYRTVAIRRAPARILAQ